MLLVVYPRLTRNDLSTNSGLSQNLPRPGEGLLKNSLMYWQIKYSAFNNDVYYTYRYYQLIVKKAISSSYYYNSELKQLQYPTKYELVIGERFANSEEDFIEWYKDHKGW